MTEPMQLPGGFLAQINEHYMLERSLVESATGVYYETRYTGTCRRLLVFVRRNRALISAGSRMIPGAAINDGYGRLSECLAADERAATCKILRPITCESVTRVLLPSAPVVAEKDLVVTEKDLIATFPCVDYDQYVDPSSRSLIVDLDHALRVLPRIAKVLDHLHDRGLCYGGLLTEDIAYKLVEPRQPRPEMVPVLKDPLVVAELPGPSTAGALTDRQDLATWLLSFALDEPRRLRRAETTTWDVEAVRRAAPTLVEWQVRALHSALDGNETIEGYSCGSFAAAFAAESAPDPAATRWQRLRGWLGRRRRRA